VLTLRLAIYAYEWNYTSVVPFICLHFLKRENFTFFGRAGVIVWKVTLLYSFLVPLPPI
jgi:hypothetical protein